jgi:hypothetical protein
MPPLQLEVSDDRSRLRVASIDGLALTLSAAEVDHLIRPLATHRALMAPVHPAICPVDSDRVYYNDNLLSDVCARGPGPVIELAMQHPGLGWTVTRLSREQAEDLQISIDFALQDIPKQLPAA